MANTVIQLKWSDATSAPTSLNVGEAAYSNTSHKLFIGDTANNVLTIGGKYFTDQQGLIFTKTNVAFDTANSAASYANAAFATANSGQSAASAAAYANGAFIAANSAGTYANSGFTHANSAFGTANSAASAASSAQGTADTALSAAGAAQSTADSAALYANGAFAAANSGVSAASYANSGFAVANSAATYANSAFARANNSLNTSSGGSITGSIGVTSNVYAGNVIANSGVTSTGGTTKLTLTDIGLVTIDVAGVQTKFGASGIESSPGIFGGSFGGNRLSLNSETNLISNRGDVVKIQTGTGGTTQNDFVFSNNSLTVPGGITANGFTAGGINVVPTLAASFSTANAAFTRANNAINANTGGTITADLVITGNLTVQGNTTYVNTQTITTQDSLIRLANNNTTGDTVDIGFYGTYNSGGVKYTGLVRQAAADYFLFKGLDTDPTANVLAPGSLTAANTGTLTANLTSYSVTINGQDINLYTTNAYTQANTAATNALSAGSYANSAFLSANTPSYTANSAAVYANAAFAAANTSASSGSYANSAFSAANSASSYANSAFSTANTDVTGISITAADYGSASAVAAFKVEANGRISSANSTAIAIAASAITSGELSVARGGTGAGTFTTNAVLLGQGTSAFSTASSSTEGHVLTINASGVPTFSYIQGGTF